MLDADPVGRHLLVGPYSYCCALQQCCFRRASLLVLKRGSHSYVKLRVTLTSQNILDITQTLITATSGGNDQHMVMDGNCSLILEAYSCKAPLSVFSTYFPHRRLYPEAQPKRLVCGISNDASCVWGIFNSDAAQLHLKVTVRAAREEEVRGHSRSGLSGSWGRTGGGVREWEYGMGDYKKWRGGVEEEEEPGRESFW